MQNLPVGWKIKRLKSLSSNITAGATPNTKIKEFWENGSIPWMSSGEVNNRYINSTGKLISETGYNKSSTSLIPKHSVLIALAGQGKTRGKVAINNIELTTNQSLAAVVPNDQLWYKYLFFYLENRYSDLRKLSSGEGGRGGLNLKILNSLPILLPPIDEQKRIADILSTWDKAIDLREKKIEKMSKQFNSVKETLINEVFSIKSKWKKVKLKNILHEENIKTSLNDEYEILSSTKEYIVKQSDYFNKQIASSNNIGYKVLKMNRLVLSPQNAWMGNINFNDKYEIGIVSPSYIIYEVIGANQDFIKHIIKTRRFIHIIDSYSEQGASIVRKNLNQKEFLDSFIHIPEDKEQYEIAMTLNSFESLLDKEEKLLRLLKNQKKGLMQQLLTGKIRVQA